MVNYKLSVICFVNSEVVLSPPISLVLIPDFTKSKIVDSNLDIKTNEDLIINQIKKLIKWI